MNIVIYARFSSHNQTEASIEGQLKVCYEYARRLGYTIVGEYKDRAISGTTDKRPEFLRMIEDSKKKQFAAVLVYQLDRFARNRYDSATYKAKLKKNGVKVISARETISDDASGILMESVLEGMAEYYSRELAQKVMRGKQLKAEKGLYTGGGVALGHKVNENKTIGIDPIIAPIVQKIFEMYASGSTVAKINEWLNSQHIKTIRGGAFNKNSLRKLLQNRRYLGIFTHKGGEIVGGIPRIVSDELFYKVQIKMNENKKAPARVRAKEEYILTTKLFCGHCRDMMTGESGTSRTGQTYHYYVCGKAKKKLCQKKRVSKKWIEDYVVRKCREILTDENIEKIVAAVMSACEKDESATTIKRLKKLLADNERAIDNLFKALESGQAAEQLLKRIQDKNAERTEIEKQIATEQINKIDLSLAKIKFFLTHIRKGNVNDIKNRKALITVFVNAIYLYDDKITFILNAGDKQVEITETLLDDIEGSAECSCIDNLSLPKPVNPNQCIIIGSDLLYIFG